MSWLKFISEGRKVKLKGSNAVYKNFPIFECEMVTTLLEIVEEIEGGFFFGGGVLFGEESWFYRSICRIS